MVTDAHSSQLHASEKVSERRKKKRQRQIKIDEPALSPLISSMYNIKAIRCRLCQHVWNNTLVTDGEMKRERRKSENEGL